jgi:hypothetical protein
MACGCYTNLRMFRANVSGSIDCVARFCMIALLALATATLAQVANPPHLSPQAPDLSPQELVRQTVAREVAAANEAGVKHMFRSNKQTPKGSQTRLYVETNEAMAGMLISSNGKSLTPEQEQAEIGHLDWLANNPDQLRKKHAREKEDDERTLRIVKALPDAFRYEPDGTQPSEAGLGKIGDTLVRLKFAPNPSYSPPSHVEQVLEGMEGYLLIDATAHRIARIDGKLYRDVSFGWGLVGRLDKGGHFLVQQADIGDGSWEITEMKLNITGKILLLKNISMVSDEILDDFQSEPSDLPFAKGVKLLKAAENNLAQGEGSINPTSTKIPQ